MESKQKFGLSSIWLKILAVIFMTMDHIALLFISRGTGDIPTSYYILRAVGKMAFPIFCYLAVEGAYKTSNIRNYLMRLGIAALGLDVIGGVIGQIAGLSIASNPMIGNAFMDMFMGVLMIYLLRRKDWFSLLAILPVAYEFLSTYTVDVYYGTLTKSDWGFFSILLFVGFFLAREGVTKYLENKALRDGLEKETYVENDGFKYQKIVSVIAMFLVYAIFYLIYRIYNYAFVLPNEFVPIGTYSVLAFVFILLYNGKKGYQNRVLQYSFYFYYPLHVLILGILSLFFGVLASVL